MKTVEERTESKGTEAALAIPRETLRQVADWKVAKVNGYALRAGKNGGHFIELREARYYQKRFRQRF